VPGAQRGCPLRSEHGDAPPGGGGEGHDAPGELVCLATTGELLAGDRPPPLVDEPHGVGRRDHRLGQFEVRRVAAGQGPRQQPPAAAVGVGVGVGQHPELSAGVVDALHRMRGEDGEDALKSGRAPAEARGDGADG